MKTFLFLLTFIIPIASFAGSTYDWQTGNQYNSYTDSQGNTTVRGYNFNNGSSWNTNIRANGDMNGFDAKGNYWNYNESTGNYNNFGTGKSCYGKGYGRVCN